MIVSMVVIFVVLGIAAALLASVSTYYQTSNKQIEINNNERIGQEAKNLLLQNVFQLEGRTGYYAPMGIDSPQGWTMLPDIFGNKRYSYSGVPFLYCPFSSTTVGTTGTKVTLPDESTYSVTTQSNPSRSGLDYVVESSYQNNNLIAAIVSPTGGGDTPPNCYDIQYNNGVYSVEGGQVWTISELDVLTNPTGNNTYNSYNEVRNLYVTAQATSDDPSNGGDGTGTGYLDYTSQSLVTNIEQFKNSNVKEMRIYLGSGNYVIEDNDLFVDNDSDFFNNKNRKLILFGNESDKPSIVAQDGNPLEFYIPNVDFEINNVDFDSYVRAEGNRFLAENSTIDRMEASYSDITVKDFTFSNETLRNLVSDNSELEFYGTINFSNTIFLDENSHARMNRSSNIFSMGSDLSSGENIIALRRNSELNVTGGSISVTNTTLANTFAFNSRSILTFSDGVNVSLNGSYTGGLLNTGELQIDGSDFTLDGNMTYGIYSLRNSLNKLNSANFFNDNLSTDIPTYGFFDVNNETLSVSGSGVNFSASTACFSGSIFSNTTGTSSTPTSGNIDNKNNESSWTCI